MAKNATRTGQLAPNRFALHFFLKENGTIHRAASGMGLAKDNFDPDLLGKISERNDKK